LDPPIGFGTRPMLMADLTVALRPDGPARMLAIFDLIGFGEYVELYGRLEGQDMIVRVGDRLAEAIEQPARFYRPRGTEFAALLEVPLATAGEQLAAAVLALRERFTRFNLTLAFGAVMLPAEALEPVDALILADERLSLNAHARRRRERRYAQRAKPAPGPAL
jgi:GGDEF domain-containing protein